MKPGLVSVSFRNLAPDEVIALCVDCGLQGIEWGGDVHVPTGDGKRAAAIARQTRDAGLSIAAYGSYYALNSGQNDRFAEVLETAIALGAPTIRVWAGRKPSSECTQGDWDMAITDSRRIADMAAAESIGIAYEYHQGTLTDSNQSAMKLLNDVDHVNLNSFWQPPNGQNVDYCLAGLKSLVAAERLCSIHVFHWWPGYRERHLLEEGAECWRAYLEEAEKAAGDRYACLEFAKDDDPSNTRRDAETLKRLLMEVGH